MWLMVEVLLGSGTAQRTAISAGAGGAGRRRPLLLVGVKGSAVTHRDPRQESMQGAEEGDLSHLAWGRGR